MNKAAKVFTDISTRKAASFNYVFLFIGLRILRAEKPGHKGCRREARECVWRDGCSHAVWIDDYVGEDLILIFHTARNLHASGWWRGAAICFDTVGILGFGPGVDRVVLGSPLIF